MDMSKLFVMLLLASVGFSGDFVLENRTSHPQKTSKIAIQWANSAREVDEGNKALMAGAKFNAKMVSFLTQMGKIRITIPKKAEYFRVLAWSKGDQEVDFHTNWVEIVPNKTYTLESDHLVPCVLMPGMGC